MTNCRGAERMKGFVWPQWNEPDFSGLAKVGIRAAVVIINEIISNTLNSPERNSHEQIE
jgi:hypothetical protein